MLTDALAGEWRKLRSVPSTAIILGILAAAVAGMALLAWYAVVTWERLPAAGRAGFSLASEPDLISSVASLCVAVLGVLAITAEYSSGTIHATFLALPRRPVVLAAKATVVAVVAFGAGEVAVAATYVLSHAIIGGRPIHGQPPMGIALFLGYGLSVMLSAVLGLSLGALTRSAAASIAALAALWYVLPIVAFHLPAPWHGWLGSLMPGALAGELAATGNHDSVYGSALSPAGALVVMAAYVVLPLATAALRIGRTDA